MNRDFTAQWKEKKCPICGKRFLYHVGWVYKIGSADHLKIFCSWGCLRKFENRHPAAIDRRKMIIDRLKAGEDVKSVAKDLGEDYSKVAYWAKRIEEGKV